MTRYSIKKRTKLKPKETPGVICIERHIHDESVVISGSLLAECRDDALNEWIEEALEDAAHDVRKCGGILGQIKTALTVMSTSTITITEGKKAMAEPSRKYAKIILAAIMFMVDPNEAEDIIRKSLARVHARFSA